jgi:tetratricopeptide (TPR) repeat protein
MSSSSTSFCKFSLLLLAGLLIVGVASAGEVTVEVRPKEVFVGEPAHLVITSDEEIPSVSELPKLPHVDWLGGGLRNEQRTVINGRRHYRGSLTLPFRINAEGTVVIPSFQVEVSGKNYTTDPVECNAKQRKVETGGGREATLDELFFARVAVGAGDGAGARPVFVGEEVPVSIQVYVSDLLDARGLAYPEVSVENAAFRDFSDQNPQSPRFLRAEESRKIENGLAFHVVTFEARLTPTGTGALSGGGRVVGTFGVRRERPRSIGGRPDPFDNAFFDEFFGSRTVNKAASFTLPNLTVQALPEAPESAGLVLGLVGEWELKARLSADSVELGSPVSLVLNAEGRGNPHAFDPPELTIPGFRVHGPEVERRNNGPRSHIQATWVLVPEVVHAQLPELIFSVFDPSKQMYVSKGFSLPLKVKPSSRPVHETEVVEVNGTNGNAHSLPSSVNQQQKNILYLKDTVGDFYERPLWRHRFWFSVSLVILGVVQLGIGYLVRLRRERMADSEILRRREWARKHRRRLVGRVRCASESDRAQVVREEVVPWLAALRGLPPGATAGEVASSVKDDDLKLAEMIMAADHADYSTELRVKVNDPSLIRRLRRAQAFLLVGCLYLMALFPALAQTEIADPPSTKNSVESMFHNAMTAYDQGRFKDAYQGFNMTREQTGETANLLYNIANSAYQLERKFEALALYERALRLAPRDPDIRGNLEFLRRDLGLPLLHNPQSPGQLIGEFRDRLRPDEWGLVASVVLWAMLIVVSLRIARRRRGFSFSVSILMTVFLLAVGAFFWQSRTTYRAATHAVVAGAATGLTAPSSLAEPTELVLKGGESVRVLEKRTEWVRIRVGQAEAWLPVGSVFMVW